MSTPLHIVHVSAYFAPAWAFGGPPRSLLALCRAQSDAGMQIDVFTTTANPGAPLAPAPHGREIEGVRARYFPLSAPATLLGSAAMAAPLAGALERADVVHLHGLFNRTIWAAARLARRAGVPAVVSPRGMLEPAALAHHAWRKRASWLVRDRHVMQAAACWHATSEAEADTLRRLDSSRRVDEVPNCVSRIVADESAVRQARVHAGVPPGARYLLSLGRIHPIKRLDVLAAAFRLVLAEEPDVHLVVAGPDERGHRAVVEPAFAGLDARVHWCGEVDRDVKNGLLVGATALAACSDSESFGMSIAEALSAGVPVVVTRTCPWPIIESSACGHWVEQRPAAVAEGLLGILRHPGEARAQGARGHALASERFSASAVASRWHAVYSELAALNQARRGRPAA